MSKYRFSLLIIGVLALGILAAGWFVGVSPQVDRINAANSTADQVRAVNDLQAIKNAGLAEDNQRLDEYKSELAQAQGAVPANRAQQALVDQVNAAAAAADVMMTTMTFDTPQSYAAPAGVPLGATSSSQLVSVGVVLTAAGDRGQLEQFAANIQGSPRLITVNSSQYTGPEDAQLTLTGTTWVLLPY